MLSRLAIVALVLFLWWRPAVAHAQAGCEYEFDASLAPAGSGDLSNGNRTIQSSPSNFFSGDWIVFHIPDTPQCPQVNKRVNVVAVNGRTCAANLTARAQYWSGGSLVDAWNVGCGTIPTGVTYDVNYFQINSLTPFSVELVISSIVPPTPTPAPGSETAQSTLIQIDFNQMFFYANLFLASVVPVLLIIFGFRLARVAVNWVRRAFDNLR